MKSLSIELFLLLFLFKTGLLAQKLVRGDESQLPQIDYSKQFNMSNFKTGTYSGFDRSFATKQFETKSLELPTYYGNLKPLPLTEWQSNKRDFYAKSIDLQEFKVKKTSDRWSQQLSLREDENFRTEMPQAYQGKTIFSRNIEQKTLDAPSTVTGESLRNLINKGGKSETVKTGRGFNAQTLGDATDHQEAAESKEQPKTESQPK